LHSFETHLKAAAFALIDAQRIPCSALQYALIPVGADWTGNENILGYADGLDASRYVGKPALQLMLNAVAQPDLPHFLILDEMNLSHVERYFADILSAIESGEPIPLYEGPERFLDKDQKQPVPGKLTLPDNLFIIGTVNVDETTYMFSPKVLDRANVIEFRMDSAELGGFLKNPKKPDIKDLDGQGAEYGPAFVQAARSKVDVPAEAKAGFESEMLLLFQVLQEHGAEFGYRVAHESARFLHFYRELGGFAEADEARALERLGEWFDDAMDAVIVQKLLPKLHGSRGKLEGLLWALGVVCAWDRGALPASDQAAGLLAVCKLAGLAEDESKYSPQSIQKQTIEAGRPVRYKASFDKILRMQKKLERDQFASFAEA
jgi:5-methylcytosine-specific restriction endonuclease McrBC GTP-binding regulatory subunit McrB